jgi:hypothetical protein
MYDLKGFRFKVKGLRIGLRIQGLCFRVQGSGIGVTIKNLVPSLIEGLQVVQGLRVVPVVVYRYSMKN